MPKCAGPLRHTAAPKQHPHSSPHSLAGQCAVKVVWQVVAVQQATGQEQGTVRACCWGRAAAGQQQQGDG